MIFDYRVQRDNQCRLFINGVRQTMWCDIPNMTTYTSSIIPPGTHTIRFESYDNAGWDSFFILDNIRFQ
jgi:hypothetical protein